MNISVVIPAFNEEKRIEDTLISVINFLRQQPYNAEVIVVNDGSRDSTLTLVQQQAQKSSLIKVLSYGRNQGKGYAVQQGMKIAEGEYKLFMDADSSTPITELHKLITLLEQAQSPDIIIGSRKLAGFKRSHVSTIRSTLSFIFAFIVKNSIALPVTDTQVGFKLFSKRAADIVFSKQVVKGWAFDVELLAISQVHNLAIKEVQVEWNYANYSRMRMWGMMKAILEILTIKLNIIRRKYI